MSRGRMGLALLSLAGLFIAVYLWLYKLGAIGTLACGTGSCETVQLSPQSKFFGIDVALIGVIGYSVLLGLSLLALQPRFAGPAWPARLLVVLAGIALLFSLYLTGLELFVIHAICRYCVASAVVIVLIFVVAMRELRPVPSV